MIGFQCEYFQGREATLRMRLTHVRYVGQPFQCQQVKGARSLCCERTCSPIDLAQTRAFLCRNNTSRDIYALVDFPKYFWQMMHSWHGRAGMHQNSLLLLALSIVVCEINGRKGGHSVWHSFDSKNQVTSARICHLPGMPPSTEIHHQPNAQNE